ncbi:DUF2868 domain-containing protein [Variovorax sp. RHLX14]|uniref:DUF2868 domain-containing protein n=1 Tax=Variovorax sp. RHLX14 TaxID=1259731 RepID=UPI003F46ED87
MKPSSSPPALSDAVITESIRLIEENGPLDDAAAMRTAASLAGREAQISRRAAELGHRVGLQTTLSHARSGSPWIGAAIVVTIVLAGLALAGSVTGNAERRINVVAALSSLLGVHAITMALWLAGLLLPSRFQKVPRVSLGWLWMTLTARVAGGRHGQAPVMLRATTRLLTQARLLPWAFGIASHAIWALSFVVVLGAVLFALAFHRYTLGWETTILDPQFFLAFVQALGRVPAWFGFPVPDAAAVMATDATAVVAPQMQRTWALWLTGCIAVYGLVPRVIALIACIAVWKARESRLRPDLSLPYYRKLLSRFDAMAPTEIVDPEGAVPTDIRTGTAPRPAGPLGVALVVAAFELAPGHAWPAPELRDWMDAMPPDAEPTLLDIDGSARSRRELLDTTARLRPHLLLIACRAASSPDRGTERLLRELLAHCGECRLWLLGDEATPDDGIARDRWQRWLTDTRLGPIVAHDRLADALGGRRR